MRGTRAIYCFAIFFFLVGGEGKHADVGLIVLAEYTKAGLDGQAMEMMKVRNIG